MNRYKFMKEKPKDTIKKAKKKQLKKFLESDDIAAETIRQAALNITEHEKYIRRKK